MLRHVPTPVRPLAVTATALFLSTLAAAQTYTAKAGDSVGGGGDSSVGGSPTAAFWDGTWTHSVRHAWSQADQGTLEGTALCNTYALYNMSAWAIAEFRFDDVVFSSTSSGPIQVGLSLTIEGNSSVVNGNGFFVTLKEGGTHFMGEATRAASGAITTTGGLAGWDMSSSFSFEHAMTVPVNTPVSLRIYMSAAASAVKGGHQANGHYTLRLGGAVPLDPSGTSYDVFNLPLGVTVNSTQAGIVDNLWSPPTDLHLTASEPDWQPGEELDLTIWNGTPGQPAGLFLTAFDGAPLPLLGIAYFTLNADGRAKLGPSPYAPVLSGHSFSVIGAALHPQGHVVVSDAETVVVQ